MAGGGGDAARARLRHAWALSDALLEGEVGGARALWAPLALRRPFVFYLGHLAAFARNTARRAGAPLPTSVLDDVFERGIDPDVENPAVVNRHHPPPPAWPAWDRVLLYRDAVRAEIAAAALDDYVLTLVAEHDLMHVETLYYMLAQGAGDSGALAPTASKSAAKHNGGTVDPARTWIHVPPGVAYLGRDEKQPAAAAADTGDFGWDNEFPGTTEHVPAFQVTDRPVTVGEFLTFVENGGYQNEKFWRPEDWAWVQRERVSHPASWRRGKESSKSFQVVTVDGLVPLSTAVLNWPAYVSLAEARAYATSVGARLPTEAEWDRVAFEGQSGVLPWGGTSATPGVHGNFGMHKRHPVPVGSFPRGKTWCGALDMFGNGWELVDSAFRPFPGFCEMELYLEYSKDFFDEKHFVLKGASWATDSLLARRSFRNFFQAHYPYVFSQFRLATSRVEERVNPQKNG